MASRRITKKKMTEIATEVVAKTEQVVKDTAEKAIAAGDAARPEVMEAKEKLTENATEAKERVKTAVKSARTKILDTCIEFDGNSVSMTEVEKAVKADAAEKGLKGEILIYLNINEKAAYYTVNGVGADEQKISLCLD